jgi:hypothetical protein
MTPVTSPPLSTPDSIASDARVANARRLIERDQLETPERIAAAVEKMARDLGIAERPARWPAAGERWKLNTSGGVYLVDVICTVDVYGVAGIDGRIAELVSCTDQVLKLDVGDVGTWPASQLEAV